MNAVLGLGRYLFAIPFLAFAAFHFMGANDMVGMVPIPGGVIWVYITGLGLLLAPIAMLIGKYDKLAAALLGLMLLIFALSIHLPNALNGDPGGMLKDLMLAGGAWMYATNFAKDNSVIG
jgi:putative oxidoreductase